MSGKLTEHLEIESKFDVGNDFVVPDLSGVISGSGVTEPEVRHLAAHYFDTSDQRLMAAKVTLRRRTGGPDEGWHLKLPEGAGRRREMQAPLGDSATAVPPQLASLAAEWVRGEPLRVVAVLETRRTVRNLTAPGGENLAEVADDRVTGRIPGPGDDPGQPVTWREVEVELVSGGPEVLAAARDRLVAAGARPSRSPSKLARLLGTRAATSAPAD
jgi:inorganic triphosphatase YgiF